MKSKDYGLADNFEWKRYPEISTNAGIVFLQAAVLRKP